MATHFCPSKKVFGCGACAKNDKGFVKMGNCSAMKKLEVEKEYV